MNDKNLSQDHDVGKEKSQNKSDSQSQMDTRWLEEPFFLRPSKTAPRILDIRGYALEREKIIFIRELCRKILRKISSDENYVKRQNKVRDDEIYKMFTRTGSSDSDLPQLAESGGTVYLIKSESDGLYKIGKTVNLTNRFQAIKTHNPSAKLIHHIKVEEYCKLERNLHNYFSHARHKGEWFSLNNEEVGWIVEEKFRQVPEFGFIGN